MLFLFVLIFLYLFTPHVFSFNPPIPTGTSDSLGIGRSKQLNAHRETPNLPRPPPRPHHPLPPPHPIRRLPRETTLAIDRRTCTTGCLRRQRLSTRLRSFETPSCHMQSAGCCAGRVLPSGRTRPRQVVALTGAVFSGTRP